MLAYARSTATEFNWGRLFAFAALFIVALFAMVEPAFAQDAFGTFEDRVSGQARSAFNTGKTILYVGAAVSLLVGVAPMLWGQVKVKWIVSCLVAAVVFALVPTLIDAFAGGAVTGIGA